jgi:hypothetical protein
MGHLQGRCSPTRRTSKTDFCFLFGTTERFAFAIAASMRHAGVNAGQIFTDAHHEHA